MPPGAVQDTRSGHMVGVSITHRESAERGPSIVGSVEGSELGERKSEHNILCHNKIVQTGLYRQRGRAEDRGGGGTPPPPPNNHPGVETPMPSPSF